MSRVIKTPAIPGSKRHLSIATASKIPTMLGLNPWMTAGELWMEMTGRAPRETMESDRMAWGHIAEQSLVRWWLHENPGWQAGPGEIAYTNEDLPFPNQATLDRRARRGRRFHILECKTSDSTRTWDSDTDLPSHVYAQVIAQMGISGIHEASVIRQLGSTVPVIYEVPWDQDLWDGMVAAVDEFMDLLSQDEYPMNEYDWAPSFANRKTGPWAENDVEWNDGQTDDYAELLAEKERTDAALEEEKQRLIKAAGGDRVIVNGHVFMSFPAPRFVQKNVPEDARHLLKDPDVMSPRLDTKKLKSKYPNVYYAGLSEPTYTFRKDALK